MFSGCSSLKSINLSSFNTSIVYDMQKMFYNCYSLNFLDISNFYNISSYYENMFYNVTNIKYINLYNCKNCENLSEVFRQTNKFFVCQKDIIINNSNAYNCCDYNFENDECNHDSDETDSDDIDSDKTDSDKTNNNPNKESTLTIGVIIGIVIGIIIFIALVIFIFVYFYKKKRANNSFVEGDKLVPMNLFY